MAYPRSGHICVTDNKRQIYILGGRNAFKKVEVYDAIDRSVITLPSDTPFNSGINLSACYFNLNGNQSNGIIYVIADSSFHTLKTTT